MVDGIEFLMQSHRPGRAMGVALREAAVRAGHTVIHADDDCYAGDFKTLMAYGVGDPKIARAREMHLRRGGVAVLWDVGYFIRSIHSKDYLRCSINDDHPQRILDLAPDDGSRWDALGLKLQDTYRPAGPVVLIGLGYKSRKYAGREGAHWESRKLAELRERFKDRKIIYRPKFSPKWPFPVLDCRTEPHGPIDDVIRGASLVVCRHSNAALDAVRLGIPVECEDGAARWLHGKPYTRENRLALLQKIAWWQWKPSEADAALSFTLGAVSKLQERRAA